MNKLVHALGDLHKAVPQGQGGNGAFHALTSGAKAALEASDGGALSDLQWGQVDQVLSAFVPDFGRNTIELMNAAH